MDSCPSSPLIYLWAAVAAFTALLVGVALGAAWARRALLARGWLPPPVPIEVTIPGPDARILRLSARDTWPDAGADLPMVPERTTSTLPVDVLATPQRAALLPPAPDMSPLGLPRLTRISPRQPKGPTS
jgi:hypothetical protein